jgi:hypothetical protein
MHLKSFSEGKECRSAKELVIFAFYLTLHSFFTLLLYRLFSNTKYSISDMMNQLTDQADLTEV